MATVTDKELKNKIYDRRMAWKKQLRSGRFEQGKLYLKQRASLAKDNLKYCCLGVACEIFGNDLSIVSSPASPRWDHSFEFVSYPDSEVTITFLPTSLRNYLGLSEASERILAKLNDSGVDFSIIAEIITLLPYEVSD
jgi:hypothetical protein